MAQDAGWLHLNGGHLGDRLDMQIMLGQLVPDLVILGNDHHLDDNVGLLLCAQTAIKRIQLANGQKTLNIRE